MSSSIPRRRFNVPEREKKRLISTPEMSPERVQKEFIENSDEFLLEKKVHVKYMFVYLAVKCDFQCGSECFGSHADEFLRRKPFRMRNGCWNYKPQQCLATECEFGFACLYAHNTAEVLYHPLIYKTTVCGYPFENSRCAENGMHCPFAHGDQRQASLFHPDSNYIITHEKTFEEQVLLNRSNLDNYSTYKATIKSHIKVFSRPIKAENFNIETFKTRFCDKKYAHEEKICTFYHDNGDKRRKVNYSAEPCKNIFDLTLKIFELKTCQLADLCKFAHNEIEILYHPDKYKTETCRTVNCNLGEFCPFIHQESSASLEEQKKELMLLVEQHSLLSTLLESSKQKLEKLAKFLCVFCKSPGSSIMHCGHLICESCLSNPKCCVCNTLQKKIRINDI